MTGQLITTVTRPDDVLLYSGDYLQFYVDILYTGTSTESLDDLSFYDFVDNNFTISSYQYQIYNPSTGTIILHTGINDTYFNGYLTGINLLP